MSSTSVEVAKADSRTKPVRNVPASAPTVPSADSRPTVWPVSARVRSRSFTTPGGTSDSTYAAGATASSTSTTVPTGPVPRKAAPTAKTSGREVSTSAPPSTVAGPSQRLGSSRSASRPPVAAPPAMAASATPIAAV